MATARLPARAVTALALSGGAMLAILLLMLRTAPNSVAESPRNDPTPNAGDARAPAPGDGVTERPRPLVTGDGIRGEHGKGQRIANWRDGLVAALLLTSVSLPVVGSALATTLYIGGPANPAPEQRWATLAYGSGAAVVVWLLVALFAGPYTTARRANVASYDAIAREVEELSARLAGGAGRSMPVACTLVRQLRSVIDGERRELRWLSGAGYVALWTTLHRAQEALLEVAPVPAVVERAVQYRWRLQDSTIANASTLISTLRRAVVALDPSAAAYLADPQDVRGKGEEQQVSAHLELLGGRLAIDVRGKGEKQQVSTAPSAPSGTVGNHALERAVIRQVVHDVNDFRDKRRAGLVHARNQLLRTVAFAGLVIYVLVSLAMIASAPPSALLAAAAFYLIGAIVGLFNRLYLDSQADTASEEDFGLSVARLLNTPIFSGLAAVGGVVVTAMLPLSTAQGSTSSPTSLAQIFSLGAYPFGCLIAAVFGLTPSLLIGRLSQPIEQYKQDLRSTETQGGK